MKLKFNPSRRTIIIVVVAAAVVAWVLLAGRSSPQDEQQPGTLDEAAQRTCSEFADGYQDADSESARLSLADRIAGSARRTDNDRIANRASEVGRAANNSDAEWEASAKALTEACQDAGWTAS